MATSKRLAAILESALPVADKLADRFGVDVAAFVLAGEAEGCMSGFFFQALELCQCERRQKHVVILALALVALGGLGRDEPGTFFQIDMAPFGFEQLADSAEGAEADPHGALHAWVDWANAGVFLAGGEGGVVSPQAGEDVA